MSTIILDLVQGASASKHVTQGYACVIIATITGIVPPVTTDPKTGHILYQAIEDLIDVVGDVGSDAPGFPENTTYLESFVPESVTDDTVKIRINYRGYQQLQVEISTTLAMTQSNVDADGEDITLTYTYPTDYVADPIWAGREDTTQGTMVNVPIAEMTLTFRFTAIEGDTGTASDAVVAFANAYLGKTNDDVWDSAPGDAETWLCESVTASTKDGGVSYEWCVTFHYRPDGWKELVVYRDPRTGMPPQDVDSYPDAVKKVKVYQTVAFPAMPPAALPIPPAPPA